MPEALWASGRWECRWQRNVIFSTIFRVFSFPCICQTRLQSENGGTITARQSTLCQCENTHELYVKICYYLPRMLITPVSAVAISAPGACFLSKWSSLWLSLRCRPGLVTGGAPWTVPQLDLQPTREECNGPALHFLLTSSTQNQQPPPPRAVHRVPADLFPNMPPMWLAFRTQMSPRREINLSARRCQTADSCWLHFHQVSAVAKLQQTWAGHLLDAVYTRGKYFPNTRIRDENLFVAPQAAAAFRSLIYNIWRHTEDLQPVNGAELRNNWEKKNPQSRA